MNDPFQTLGVPARFDLDAEELAQRHRDLSRALHPDKFAGAGAQERRLSLSRAIEVHACSLRCAPDDMDGWPNPNHDHLASKE